MSTNHFWSSTAKQCCHIILINWSRWGLVWKCKKAERTLKICLRRLSSVIQVSRIPENPNWFENIFTPFYNQNLHCCCQAKSVSMQPVCKQFQCKHFQIKWIHGLCWASCIDTFCSLEMFCGLQNFPNFPSAWGWVNNDLIFIFVWAVLLKQALTSTIWRNVPYSYFVRNSKECRFSPFQR